MSITVPGKEVDLGGEKYVLAPLNVAALKQYRDEIKNVFAGTVPDIELVARLAHASLRRNYPDIALEKVEEIVDYGNMFEVWETVMNVAGLAISAGNVLRRVQEAMGATGSKT